MPELKKDLLNVEYADLSESRFFRVKAVKMSFEDANLSGTKFVNTNMSRLQVRDVNLAEASVNDVNLAGTTIKDANLSGVVVDHVHMFGANFRNIVLPMEGDPNYSSEHSYEPITFENCVLKSTQFDGCDLSNVDIKNCNITGLKINGVLIEDLLKAVQN